MNDLLSVAMMLWTLYVVSWVAKSVYLFRKHSKALHDLSVPFSTSQKIVDQWWGIIFKPWRWRVK